MKYLSELFLDTINNNYSKRSVRNAIIVCYNEYCSRTVEQDELRAFLDVVREFDFSEPEPEKYTCLVHCFRMLIIPNMIIK